MVRRELDVAYVTSPQNESKKLIKLWKPELCSWKMCKTYITQEDFIWSYMHINFILVENKSCISYFGTMHSMKTEFFYTILITTIGLLKCLNKSTDI